MGNDSTPTISLSVPTLTLLWSILLSLVGGVVFLVKLNYQVEDMNREIETIGKTLGAHVSLEGHPVMLERVKAMEREYYGQRKTSSLLPGPAAPTKLPN